MSVCDAKILKIMYKAEKTGNTITMTTNDYYEDENSNSGLDVRIKYKDSNGGIGIGYYSDGKINYY